MTVLSRAFSGPITGRKFLSWMVAFFGVIAAVNAAFIFFALNTWPGLTTGRAYDEGLEYNKVLEAADAQNALGWRSQVRLGGTTPKGRVLSVDILGPEGPVDGLNVHAELSRPVGDGTRITVTLEPEHEGHYIALVRVPTIGRWRVELRVGQGSDAVYRMVHDLHIPGAVQ